MVAWSLALAVLSVATVLVLVADRLGRIPGEKRVHLYEDERGNRANPFGDFSEGASDASSTCRSCGGGLESEAHRYCGSCFESGVAE